MGAPDFTLAYACACACERAYDERSFESPLAHALVVPVDGAVILAFRGTKGIRDVVTDLQFFRSRYGIMGATVHHGFMDGWLSLERQVLDCVIGLRGARLIVTGHSYGGALARFCVHRLGARVAEWATFGEPRSGNAEWAAECDEQGPNGWRYINSIDAVPRIPPALWGNRHAKRVVFLPPAPAVPIVNPPLGTRLFYDALSIYADYRNRRASAYLDHAIHHYRERLEGVVKASGLQRSGLPPAVVAQYR